MKANNAQSVYSLDSIKHLFVASKDEGINCPEGCFLAVLIYDGAKDSSMDIFLTARTMIAE